MHAGRDEIVDEPAEHVASMRPEASTGDTR